MEVPEALNIMKQVCREQLLTSEALTTLANAAVKSEVKLEDKEETEN